MNFISAWIPLVIAITIVGLVLAVSQRLLLGKGVVLNADQRLPRQLLLIVITLVGVVAITLTLPVSESSRNQVLALVGVLVSGVIAFSSTTLVSNLIAGLVLRFNRPFRTGDFIRCNEYFGRVSEKGLLDTEIQTEYRDLVSIANSYLVNNPVSVIRASGTLVTANVSIGFDVHHATVTELLERATQKAGLTDGFVQITELGNFSVSYRVAGLLTEIKSLLTAKSKLHRAMLDELHESGIEIMSPNIIASRPMDPNHSVIAKPTAQKQSVEKGDKHEDIAFDKAEKAEQHELSIQELQEQVVSYKEALAVAIDSEEKQRLTDKIERCQQNIVALQEQHQQRSADPSNA
ncbi:mechanosensitive ion channel [Alteromonas sp. ASW11-36]|uniref:Small-conductance mechanosensitive channel n=1 Tax=Alteromonas arenosi TaxID=3055817 RepID=A0ABT7SZU7_9ALTE|nr:mechanosensitive ion channel domain-containing protein [Alteromonas sp. ASW11-36]MDM7861529.1 mechanosensitive ion channel [Alteromonas sp. ASW11-36]